jgi:hypothetical protein
LLPPYSKKGLSKGKRSSLFLNTRKKIKGRCLKSYLRVVLWRHDSQQKDIQYNDTQHDDTVLMARVGYAECLN